MQRAFMYSIKNVIEKGMFMKGFLTIRHASRIKAGHNLVEKVLTKHFLTRYYTSYTKQAFHIWKEQEFVELTSNLDDIRGTHNETMQAFKSKVVNVKDMNTANILHFFNKRMRDKVFFAWQKRRHMDNVRAY